MSPRWRKFEKRISHSGAFEGYRVQTQKVSTSTGKRPDVFAVHKRNPKKRKVADAKYVKELTAKHVEQVRGYKGHPFYAQKGIIFVKKTTKVPRDVRNLAKKSNIKIIKHK